MNSKPAPTAPLHPILVMALFALLALVGCARDPRDLSLLEAPPAAAPTPTEEDEAERTRLDEMQLVQVQDVNTGEMFTMNVRELFDNITGGVAWGSLNYGPCRRDISCVGGTQDCAFGACFNMANMCMVRFMQSIALVRAEPVTFDLLDGTPVSISAQSAPTKAALLRFARSRMNEILLQATPFSLCGYSGASAPSEAIPDVPTTSFGPAAGALYAETLAEAFRLTQELTFDAVDAIVDAGDAQRSQTLEVQSGAARAIAGAELSRAEAAHLLIGGDPGILGSTSRAFCGSPELSGRARRALGLIRRAAPSPALVKDLTTTPTNTFLNGSLTALPAGSIAVRLAYLDGLCTGSPAVCTVTPIEKQTGISTEDFVQARSYLIQEIDAFARSTASAAVFIPTRVGTAAQPVGVDFFASTRNEPTPPPPEYYAALARYTQPGWVPPFQPFNWDLSRTLHQAITDIRGNSPVLVNLAKAQTTFPDQWKLINGTISGLLSDEPRLGLFERSRSTAGTTVFRAFGFSSADGLRIVRGMDGLTCATSGTVEGVPCTSLTGHSVGSLATPGPTGWWFDRSAQATVTVSDSTTPLFLVRPRNTAELVPGGYDYLLGFVVMNTTTGTTYSHAIMPDLDRKAGELLRPSQRLCTRSAVECDGTLFDERLPLENELSDDGDGVESSWRHYLALAEQAANEAHALGEQVIVNGLEVDRSLEAAELRKIADQQRFIAQAEAELETVQDICGTAMSTDELLGILNVNLSGFSANNSSCAVPADCCAPAAAPCSHSTCVANVCQPMACSQNSHCCPGGLNCEFKCVSNKCARTVEGILSTPTSTEGLSRIQECVGDGTVVPYAIIGTESVCIWNQTGNSNMICHGKNEQFPCPAAPRRDATGALTCSGVPFPSGVTPPTMVERYVYNPTAMKDVDVRLALVQSGIGVHTADPCVDLRKLRHRVGGAAQRQEICNRMMPSSDFGSEYFIGYYDQNDASIVDNVEAHYTFPSESVGSRVNIYQDRNYKWSTYIPFVPPRWPCAEHPNATAAECALHPTALFCQRVNCAATTVAAEQKAIATLNQRLVEATVLLKGLSRADYHRVVVPAQLGANFEPYTPAQVPAQPLGNTPFGTYRVVSYAGQHPIPIWRGGAPLNFGAYSAIGNPSPAPVFYRFFAPASSTPVTYPILNPAQSGAYPALVRLPNWPQAYPALNELRFSTQICGDRQSATYGAFNINRFRDNTWPPNPTMLPRGDGVFSVESTLDRREAPDRPYLTTRFRYDDQGVADAAELLCELERGKLVHTAPGATCPPLDPGSLVSESQFTQVRDYATCKVAEFERALGSLVLPRVPLRVVQGIHDASVGNFPGIGGQMGAQVHRLRAALIRFGELNISMRDRGAELKEVVDDMVVSIQAVQVRNAQETIDVDIADLRGRQARIRLSQIDFQQQAAMTKAALDCAGGFMNGLAGAATSFGTSMLAGASDCVNSLVSASMDVQNLGYERQIAEIEENIANRQEEREILDQEYVQLEHARDLIRQRGRVRSIAGAMAQLRTEAQASVQEIMASLAELESLRLQVLRSMSRATQYQSTSAAVTRNIDKVLNAKLDTSKTRYHQAHQNAIRLTFLAKRAIEQRLGVHLSELRADLPLVKAPATWESTICTAEGINYNAIRDTNSMGRTVNFAGAYIGDYVRDLRNVVESYRLEFDFQEGTDEVVASVRDDVFGTRQLCPQSLGNLLTYSGDPSYLTADPAQPGWLIQGCPVGANGVDNTCLDISFDTNSPLNQAVGGSAFGYRITWGTAANLSERLAQQIRLSKGRYRLSWFTREVTGAPQMDAGLFDLANVAVPAAQGGSPVASRWGVPALNAWTRYYRIFDIATDDAYWVKLIPGTLVSGVGSVAGVMLDPLSGSDAQDDPSKLRAPPYIATEADTTRMIKACQDSDGSAFRGQAWTRRCEKLCRDGFSGSCEQSDRTNACYWETTIGIDQRDLEEGRIFKQAGFATGNFNYRIENIAVNFVGTGVRNCEDAENPATCYAGGFVPYSLKHIGPYYVKNHEGDEFNVKLFTGTIERARGLGMERYLTNPLSSTDRELLTPYVRTEFQGRPFDGSLLLRVWEDPGVDFNAIADVQLYIKYRYWTRSQ